MYTYVPHRIQFAYEHSFIDNITLGSIDYTSATTPLWSAVMLSLSWKAWRFVSKEFAAFKESASVKKKWTKIVSDYIATSI